MTQVRNVTLLGSQNPNALRREGIPDRFEFKGGCIFITNVDFENVPKKIKDPFGGTYVKMSTT